MNSSTRTILLIWLISIATAVGVGRCSSILRGMTGTDIVPLDLFVRLTQLFIVALSVYLLVIFVRFVLRKLFWRVGRRLALSYVLIGLLPFFFFAVLMVVIGYLMAGVLSQTSLKMERVTSLANTDQWNLQYVISGERPVDMPESIEILDTNDRGVELPQWLVGTRFSGLVRRGNQPLMVVSRVYSSASGPRTVVLGYPIDQSWAQRLADRNGMMTAAAIVETNTRGSGDLNIEIGDDAEGGDPFDDFFVSAFRRGGIIWGDISPPVRDWESGELLENRRVFTMLSNPWPNLLDFYMGDSRYIRLVGIVILSVVVSLGLVYLLAVLLASWLIFSISRAVNRIDRASKAVERGDFSHRIAMRPTSQIGEVAQSFDRMTESIGSLLHKVAEKERLQSEIDIAATIQRNMLPAQGPSFPGVSFAAHFEPSAAIGGDYYDVFNIDRTRLAVAIGDVSGHGLSTGLVMAMVKAALTTLVEEGADEASLFVRLNELVSRSTDSRTFMTLGFTIFDLEKRTIRHTNAGHLYPYIVRRGQPLEQIEAPALPLGLKRRIQPGTVELPLRDGDMLVYLSDGIIEAQSEAGEPFGFDRLEEILGDTVDFTPNAVRDSILRELALHSGTRSADDDRTVMVVSFDQTFLPPEDSAARPVEETPHSEAPDASE